MSEKHSMLTPEQSTRVAEIRTRLQAATPGPWVAVLSASVTENYDVVASDLKQRVAADTFDAGCIDREDDALLIANAPSDLEYLLELAASQQEEVERLRKDAARLDWLEGRSRIEVEPYLRPDCGAVISFEPENEVAFRQMIDTAMRVRGRARCLCQGTRSDPIGGEPRCRSCGGLYGGPSAAEAQ